MDDALRAQRDFALRQLDDLTRRGRQLSAALAADPDDAPALAAVRPWQQASAAAIHQLSGGSKAHWLSRAFSGALLIRSADGGAAVDARVGEILDRILDVLGQAGASLSGMDAGAASSSTEAPATRRFEFVHNPQLRPVLEQAFVDGGRALEDGDVRSALMTSCGVLEAIITDALEHRGWRMADGGFEARIAAAERAGLIRGGCARLPPVARRYRDIADADGPVSERDAKVVRQVLHIVMRDLDPGRVEEIVRDLGPRQARALNRTVAEGAAEWMYYHPESDPLEGVELPSLQPD
jgi:hypothetical protein